MAPGSAILMGFSEPPMSIAEAYDMPVARRPLVPPSPPRAPDDMTAFGRMKAIRESPIGSWGQRAYEDDIVRGRFFGRSSFILNTPDCDPACAGRQLRELHRARRPVSGCCVRCSARAC